jgi:GTP-binding protein
LETDQSDQTDCIEEARRVFAGPIHFLLSAPKLKFLPAPDCAEVAFAGRSNVGKSSLINALCGRNGLARTSNTPGRTQELNFFDVAGSGSLPEGTPPLFRLVDMPGYGYAKAPKETVRAWRHLINDYLRGRPVLKRVLLLIDSRHGLKEVDTGLLDMMDEAAVSYRIVLTKADKVRAEELAEIMTRTAEAIRKRPAAHPEIIATSSEKGMGIPELRAAVIDALV